MTKNKKRYAKFGDYRVVIEPGEYSSTWKILEYWYNHHRLDDERNWQVTASGHTKWDGCSNWSAGDDCAVHGCNAEREDAGYVDLFKAITWAIHRAWLTTEKRQD